MLLSDLSLEVAEIVVHSSGHDGRLFQVDDVYAPFISEREADLELIAHYERLPAEYEAGELVFDNGGVWTLSCRDQGWVWRFRSPARDPVPRRLGFFSPDYHLGRVYLNDPDLFGAGLPTPWPLYFPLDRFLYTTLLADRDGLMFHACGIDFDGQGLLFVGQSEAGKSTMATLWHGHPGVTVLSDERVAIRDCSGRFWLYGTPWFGTAGLCSPQCSALKAIFLLEKGPDNRVARLSPVEAILRMSHCAFWPAWSPSGMDRALSVVGKMVEQVPCFELTFFPDFHVADVVGELLGKLS